MKRTCNTFHLALLSALFLFAGMLTLRAAAAQQTGDQTDASSTKKPSESKQPPAAAPGTTAPPGAAANTVPATAAKPAPATSTPAAAKPAATQQTPPAKGNGLVWVNTDSGIYHKPGSRYYGKTKQGKYMSEADAIKAGYRAAGKN
jgi:cytoskeletal protein RodZ